MYELDKKQFNKYIYDVIDDYAKRIEVYYGGAGSRQELWSNAKDNTKSVK